MSRSRTIIAAAFALLLLLVVIAIARGPKSDPDAPRFVPAASQPAGPFGRTLYSWDEPVPFRDGRVWMGTALSRTNRHQFLYDLNQNQVLGELFNAGAIFCNQDQTKLLCMGPASPAATLKGRLAALLNRISPGKFSVPTNQIETFWRLDLRDNSARRLGDLSQIPGTGSLWRPAPGFRFGYNVPNNQEENSAFFLCDLETPAFSKIKFAGDVRGWWDDHQILIKQPANDYVLFDALTRQTSPFLTVGAIGNQLKAMGIAEDPAALRTLFDWNGSNYNVYLCLSGARGGFPYTNTTFLIKVERPGPTLKLLYRDFQFAWLGRLDASATHYLYPGESGLPGKAGNGGVFLRNLTNGTTRTLIAPDNSGQYSLPRFFGDSVIYSTNGVSWRIDLNGSNNVPAFFPPGK